MNASKTLAPHLTAMLAFALLAVLLAGTVALPQAAKAASLMPNHGTLVKTVIGERAEYGFGGGPGMIKKYSLKGSTLTVRAKFTNLSNYNQTPLTTKKYKLAKRVKLYHSESDHLICHGSFKRAKAVKYVKRWCKYLGATPYMKGGKVVAFRSWN